MTARRLLPCGEHAVLVEVDGPGEVLPLAAAVRAAAAVGDPAFADVVDVVPGARTVLVVTAEEAGVAALRGGLAALVVSDHGLPAQGSEPAVQIEVHYDGPDLDEVATLTGLSRGEVVRAHTGSDWRVSFCGFVPGFAYLVGGDPRLRVPRRREPRTSVPAGAVALAGEFSAVYPRSSPGGWQLIGRTEAVLFDVRQDPPALLAPGRSVRFVAG